MAYPQFLSKSLMLRFCMIVFTANFFMETFLVSECHAWLIFHKPEYKGKVIDAETGEPIEGVVVVALYNTHSVIGGPAGLLYNRIHLKEVLTDNKGEFLIPSYTTMMGPNSTENYTEFIIYKPGYASYPNYQSMIVPFNFCGPEYLFIKEVGTTGIVENKAKSVSIIYGIAKLPKLNTWEDRRNAVPSRPTDTTPEGLSLLNEKIKKESEWIRNNKGWRR